MRICAVDGCEKPFRTKDLCAGHYMRLWRYGSPTGERERVDPEDWFWGQVDRSGGPDACWPWTGGLSHGYGRFHVPGSGRNGTTESAHRHAWTLVNGRQPDPNLYMCHRCDNPPCCNPAHLYEGTPTDNQRDAMNRGRRFEQQLDTCRNGHPWTPETTIYGRFAGRPHVRTCALCREARKPADAARARRDNARRKAAIDGDSAA